MEKKANVIIENIGGSKLLVIGADNYEPDHGAFTIITIRVAAFDINTLKPVRTPMVMFWEGNENGDLPNLHQLVPRYMWMCIEGAKPTDAIDADLIVRQNVTESLKTADAMRMFVRMQFGVIHFETISVPDYVLVRDGADGIYATTIDTLISYLHCNMLNVKAYQDLVELSYDFDNGQRRALEDYARFRESLVFKVNHDGDFETVSITDHEELTVFMDYVSSQVQNAGHTEASKMLDAWFEI